MHIMVTVLLTADLCVILSIQSSRLQMSIYSTMRLNGPLWTNIQYTPYSNLSSVHFITMNSCAFDQCAIESNTMVDMYTTDGTL